MKLHPDMYGLLKSFKDRELTPREVMDSFGELTEDDFSNMEKLRKYEREKGSEFPLSGFDSSYWQSKGMDLIDFFNSLHASIFNGLKNREKINRIKSECISLYPEWKNLFRYASLYEEIRDTRSQEDDAKHNRELLDKYFNDSNGSLNESFTSWWKKLPEEDQ